MKLNNENINNNNNDDDIEDILNKLLEDSEDNTSTTAEIRNIIEEITANPITEPLPSGPSTKEIPAIETSKSKKKKSDKQKERTQELKPVKDIQEKVRKKHNTIPFKLPEKTMEQVVEPDNLLLLKKNFRSRKRNSIIRICILTVISCISVFLALANENSLPIISVLTAKESLTSYLFVQLILSATAILTCADIIIRGLFRLITFNSDKDTITALTVLASFTALLVMIKSQADIFFVIHIANLALLLNLVGKDILLKTAIKNINVISENEEKYCTQVVNGVQSLKKGNYTVSNKILKISDFEKNFYKSDTTDKFMRVFAPIALILSAGAAFVLLQFNPPVTTSLQSPQNIINLIYLQYFSVMLTAISAFYLPLVTAITTRYLLAPLQNQQIALNGFGAVAEYCKTDTVILKSKELFPDIYKKIRCCNISSLFDEDMTISYLISMLYSSRSMLEDNIAQIIRDSSSRKPNRKLEDFMLVVNDIVIDWGGVTGHIDGKTVLLGNREYMINNEVKGLPKIMDMPMIISDSAWETLYLAIGGENAAVIGIDLRYSNEIRAQLKKLSENNIHLLIYNTDTIVTVAKISKIFGLPEDLVSICSPASSQRGAQECLELTAPVKCCSAKGISPPGFIGTAKLILTSLCLKRTLSFVSMLSIFAGLLGFILSFMLIFEQSSGFFAVNTSIILFYNSVCALCVLLLTLICKKKL